MTKYSSSAEREGRHVPRRLVDDGRLEQRLAVDDDGAHRDFHALAGQPDNSLHVHQAGAGHPDGDDVPAGGLTPGEREAVREIQGAVVIGRLHADAAQTHGQQNDAEHDDGCGHEHGDANGGVARVGAEKK